MARTKPIPTHVDCQFSPVVDSNETLPYLFRSHSREIRGHRVPLIVTTERQSLWSFNRRDVTIGDGKRTQTHFVGFADYTIKGFEEHFAIERKTVDDLFGTLGGRRGRFECEIKRLHEDCKCAYLLIEGTLAEISVFNSDAIDERNLQINPLDQLLNPGEMDEFGQQDDLAFTFDSRARKGRITPATVIGTWSSWTMKYPTVQWVFASNRSMAEMACFKLMQDFWDKVQEGYWPDLMPLAAMDVEPVRNLFE